MPAMCPIRLCILWLWFPMAWEEKCSMIFGLKVLLRDHLDLQAVRYLTSMMTAKPKSSTEAKLP